MPDTNPTLEELFQGLDRGSGQDIARTILGGAHNALDPIQSSAINLNLARSGAFSEGFRIRDVNEQRFGQASDRLKQRVGELSTPTITEDDINTLFAQEAAMNEENFLQNMSAVGESIGLRGVSGGLAADLAVQAHADFQRALAQSKGNIRIAKIQADAADKARNLNAEFALANFLATPADETGLFTLMEDAGVSANLLGAGMAERSANLASKRAARAGEMSMYGSLAGGALGAIGAL